MIRNIKIKRFLIFSFSIIIVIMGALGGASVYFTRMLANLTIDFYEGGHTVQVEVGEIKRLMSDVDSSIRGTLIDKNPSETEKGKAKIQTTIAEIGSRIAIVQNKFTGDPQILKDADAVVARWLATIDTLIADLEKQDYAEASALFRLGYMDADEALDVAVSKVSESAGLETLNYYEGAKRSRSISIVVISATILFNIALTLGVLSIVIRSITVPLAELTRVADSMARGKLDLEIKFTGKNEFGQLAGNLKKTIATLSGYVGNIDETLGRIAQSDMTATVDMDYIGDFMPIKVSLERITTSLNTTMCKIEESANQVTGGADQISTGAQILSQGATEQASSVEELLESVHAVSDQVQLNAANTAQTNRLTQSVGEQLSEGNKQMKELVSAISEINHSSARIAKIIKTIEDIAFQTNILALNAAVEAARAGNAGKGFAVVADEVRSLASKSAEAAKSTTELIENSVKAVENGTRIASGTAQTIEAVVSGAMQITEMLDKISDASERQASDLSDISQGVKQVAVVIETNSASAEESAASSEELSGQAQILKSLVAQFKLNRNDGAALSWSKEEASGEKYSAF